MTQTPHQFTTSDKTTRQYDKALRSIYDELFEINATDNICRLLHHPGGENNLPADTKSFSVFIRKIAEKMIYPADKNRFLNFFDVEEIRTNFSFGLKHIIGEFRKLSHGNKYCWVSLTIIPLKQTSDKELYLCCLTGLENKDVSEAFTGKKRHNCYDQLTGLPSKAIFHEKVRSLLSSSKQQYCVILFDINQFKLVNDFFGVHTGDRLLCHIASLLEEYFAASNESIYCRLEADRFAVCCPFSETSCTVLIAHITNGIKACPLNFELAPYFGLYLPESTDLPVNIMCDRALLALQTIKGQFGTNYAFYEERLLQLLLEKQEITKHMEQGLQKRQFEIYLQPKVHLITNEIVGAEALVRWNHPTKGLLSPAKFIPVFEENGFIIQLDAFVWEETCRLLRKWFEEGRRLFPISVNVSRVDLLEPSFFQTITGLVEKYGIEPRLLNLELTETAYVKKYDEIKLITKYLQAYGFSVHMDDFGSGYSALNMLQDIAVDTLKIDLSFMSGFEESGRGRNILSSVIRMAKWLDLPVIIEGVETEEQVVFLKSIGCTVAQGYYFSKPVSVDKFEISLKENYPGEAAPGSTSPATAYVNKVNIEDFWSPTSAFNLLFDALPEASAIYEYHENNLELLRANDAYYQLLAIPRENLYFAGTHLLDYIHEADRKAFVANLPLNPVKSPVENKFRRILPDGRKLWLHSKIHFLTGDLERILYYASIKEIPLVRE